MADYGIEYLRKKLESKRPRVLLRYQYYEMKNEVKYYSKLMPAEYAWMSETLGWCAKAADSLADRLNFREFRDDNFKLNEIYQLNNADILFDSAVLSAAISSCCFIYISADDNGYPRLQVIDGGNATGISDPITGMLSEGYAVLERNKSGNPSLEAYFAPGLTEFYTDGELSLVVENPAPYPPAGADCVPARRYAALWPQSDKPGLHEHHAGRTADS